LVCPGRLVDEDWQATINLGYCLGVAASSENWHCAGIRIDQRKIRCGQHKAAIIWRLVRRIVEEKGALSGRGAALRATTNEHAELEPTIDVGKERLPPLAAPVLEIEQALHAAFRGN